MLPSGRNGVVAVIGCRATEGDGCRQACDECQWRLGEEKAASNEGVIDGVVMKTSPSLDVCKKGLHSLGCWL